MCSSGTLILRPRAYKPWVGGVSPRCGIEQIRVSGTLVDPCPSQSEQYLIGSQDESPPTKRRVVMVHSSVGQRLIRHEWEASLPDVGLSKFMRVGRRLILTHPKANNTWLGVETKVLMCCSGTFILRLKAYKAWVGGVSPRCGIEQIRADGT